MSTVLQPLSDRVLVKQDEASDTTRGGLIIPDQAKQKPKEGVVVSVGPGKVLENGHIIPMTVGEGDRVVFASYAGQEVELDGEAFLLLTQDEILARVKRKEDK